MKLRNIYRTFRCGLSPRFTVSLERNLVNVSPRSDVVDSQGLTSV